MRVQFSLVHTVNYAGNLVTLSKKQIFDTYTGDDELPYERAMPPTYTLDGMPVVSMSTGKYQLMAGGDLLTEIATEPSSPPAQQHSVRQTHPDNTT